MTLGFAFQNSGLFPFSESQMRGSELISEAPGESVEEFQYPGTYGGTFSKIEELLIEEIGIPKEVSHALVLRWHTDVFPTQKPETENDLSNEEPSDAMDIPQDLNTDTQLE